MINSNREHISVVFKLPNSGYFVFDESLISLVASHISCDGKLHTVIKANLKLCDVDDLSQRNLKI